MIDINLLTRSEKIKIFISSIFFVASIVLFAYSIQRYQVLTSSRAEEPVPKDISFTETSNFGIIDQVYSVTISDISKTDAVTKIKTDIISRAQIRLVNPTINTLDHTNFKDLANLGTQWTFSFQNMNELELVAAKYYVSYTEPLITEITSTDGLTAERINTLITSYPKIVLHAPNSSEWQRTSAKAVLDIVQPPKLGAISFYISVNNVNQTINDYVKQTFTTFYNASNNIVGDSNVVFDYPNNIALALTDIRIPAHTTIEHARKLGVISSAIASDVQATGANKAPIVYINLGSYDDMTAIEQDFTKYVSSINLMTLVWPQATPSNIRLWDNPNISNADPVVGFIGKGEDNKYAGILVNTKNESVSIKFPAFFVLNSASSTTRTVPVTVDTNNVMTLQAYESVAITGQIAGGTTITPSVTVTGGAGTPFPTLPSGGAGQLVCDAGDDAYDSNTLRVTNNTTETIDDLTSVTHRCTYIKDKVRKGYYKCETCQDPDEVGNPDCQIGVADPNSSIVEFTLAPGESKTITVNANACETIQVDVYNTDDNAGDSPLECYNVRSRYTDPAPPARWQGGIGFGISQNSTGYNEATGTCPAPTTPVPTTPVPTTPIPTTPVPSTPVVDTETPTPTPTLTPTSSPTPTPTLTPTPTNTPSPTFTPVPPTVPPTPTNTPPQNIAVNEQPPGITPWAFILVPVSLLILGLLL